MINVRMQTTDPDDLRRLAELLAHLHAWRQLQQLVTAAGEIDDPEAREVAEDFASKYANFWSAPARSPQNQ